jgi:hypothetical protein
MPLSSRIRWSLIGICGAVLLFFGPVLLILGGNLGAEVLNIVLDRRPTRSEVAGRYKYQAPWGNALLQIDEAGTFQEQITENGKPSRLINGHWNASDGDNCLRLTFMPFGMVWDQDHQSQSRGFGTQFYKPRHGKTYGVVDDDLGEKFEQQ